MQKSFDLKTNVEAHFTIAYLECVVQMQQTWVQNLALSTVFTRIAILILSSLHWHKVRAEL